MTELYRRGFLRKAAAGVAGGGVAGLAGCIDFWTEEEWGEIRESEQLTLVTRSDVPVEGYEFVKMVNPDPAGSEYIFEVESTDDSYRATLEVQGPDDYSTIETLTIDDAAGDATVDLAERLDEDGLDYLPEIQRIAVTSHQFGWGGEAHDGALGLQFTDPVQYRPDN